MADHAVGVCRRIRREQLQHVVGDPDPDPLSGVHQVLREPTLLFADARQPAGQQRAPVRDMFDHDRAIWLTHRPGRNETATARDLIANALRPHGQASAT
ncbi:MAG: hypothetical protein E6I52_08075 [Chloroflexi bacterium]|nr:MAG: hypothetical protein E6I52_08075 [Chloroflexota bacterium]